MWHLKEFKRFLESDTKINTTEQKTQHVVSVSNSKNVQQDVSIPSVSHVKYYLERWDTLENYHLQELALDRLFFELCPGNTDITDILLKASTLNDFYSTNIFSIYPLAKHILSLDIDRRLKTGDVSLVTDIQYVSINGTVKNFYSFATKYCSHHNPLDFPIYDSYVDKVLCYFRNRDSFTTFTKNEITEYSNFKRIIIDFRNFYHLSKYNLKQIDKYLWQLGKKYFPKNYSKKAKQ